MQAFVLEKARKGLRALKGSEHRNLATAVAAVMAVVVDDAELAWGNAVDRGSGMHHILAVGYLFQRGWQEFRSVANLQCDRPHRGTGTM